MQKLSHFSRQKGFTLIELMVALTLGLIIVAAAVQLFTGGILSSRLQQANAEIQDSGIFGMDYVIRDIRFANQDNLTNLILNDITPYGGIVLTGSTATNNNTNFVPKVGTGATDYINAALLSRGQGDTVSTSTTGSPWKGVINATLKNAADTAIANPVSDQLTIQFIAPTQMTNCEGSTVLAGDLVVQRYFLRADSNGAATDYALACDANTPETTAANVTPTPSIVSGLGDAGQIIIPRVDHFHVLIGANTTTTNKTTTPATVTQQFAYYTIPQYRTAAAAARTATTATSIVETRISSIQISVLVRSANNAQNTAIDVTQPFIMVDQKATPSNTTTRYQRRAYSTTIALRNAMGENL